jgi:hypothetical protein
MHDTIIVRTQVPREWDFVKNHVITDTWVVSADGNKVELALVDAYPDDNMSWALPPDAARSLGESLIKYAGKAEARKRHQTV